MAMTVSKETRYSGCERYCEMCLKEPMRRFKKVWKAWSYKFETWFSSQWGTGQTALDYARKKGGDPITAHDLFNSSIADSDSDAIGSHLHVALVSLTTEQQMALYSTGERSVG